MKKVFRILIPVVIGVVVLFFGLVFGLNYMDEMEHNRQVDEYMNAAARGEGGGMQRGGGGGGMGMGMPGGAPPAQGAANARPEADSDEDAANDIKESADNVGEEAVEAVEVEAPEEAPPE